MAESLQAIRIKTSKAGVIFGMIFAGLGAVVGWFIIGNPLMHLITSASWTTTECVVLTSNVEQSRDSDGGAMYEVRISYRYEVNGTTYTGNRHNFFSGRSNVIRWKQEAVRAFPVENRRTVYYDPRNPSESVLHRGFVPDAWFGAIPLVFVLAGTAVAIGSVRASKRAQSPLSLQGRRREGTIPAASSGSRTFDPSGKPMKRLIGFLIATVISGGLTYIFSRTSAPKFFVFIPGGIALLFLTATVRAFLALYNPVPVLTLNPGSLVLGEPFSLDWQLKGGTVNCDSLSIQLEGREETTYQRGTRTYTDKNVFHKQVLFQTASALETRDGHVSGEIPRGLMHSFTASSNKIIWELVVTGAIPKWPDIDERFVVDILPLGIQ